MVSVLPPGANWPFHGRNGRTGNDFPPHGSDRCPPGSCGFCKICNLRKGCSVNRLETEPGGRPFVQYTMVDQTVEYSEGLLGCQGNGLWIDPVEEKVRPPMAATTVSRVTKMRPVRPAGMKISP